MTPHLWHTRTNIEGHGWNFFSYDPPSENDGTYFRRSSRGSSTKKGHAGSSWHHDNRMDDWSPH
eukprot:scaffold59792_cov29-Attheya_sp.AAC.1